jgi:hypothetical protein
MDEGAESIGAVGIVNPHGDIDILVDPAWWDGTL